ncbi:signal peptide-containing protein [Theileria equi strain WA]|uniref:Signal peptide-containing protein n=1 Tax=Theileria equi strain WA TaxID=1537102 RepID=L0AVX6_THEEQ|nr:signal peptide-containing protein [Theileria equi strain WA]AFZ79705.1 signal peptide-containing protein [Theileria equi strain WA]|eukprot:XP_004829371.1 signal peptide-containing protein [Theileria equi strain WA]
MFWLNIVLGVAVASCSLASHDKTTSEHVPEGAAKGYSAIYKRKHNVDKRTALGTAKEVLTLDSSTHKNSDLANGRYSTDAFNVYYPPTYKGEDNEHLLLGNVTNGLSDPAVDVLPGALTQVLGAVYGYLSEEKVGMVGQWLQEEALYTVHTLEWSFYEL